MALSHVPARAPLGLGYTLPTAGVTSGVAVWAFRTGHPYIGVLVVVIGACLILIPSILVYLLARLALKDHRSFNGSCWLMTVETPPDEDEDGDDDKEDNDG